MSNRYSKKTCIISVYALHLHIAYSCNNHGLFLNIVATRITCRKLNSVVVVTTYSTSFVENHSILSV